MIGGLSAKMTLLHLDRGGERHRVVVRMLGAGLAREFALIERLATAGLPVVDPIYFDDSLELIGSPFAVLEHIDGSPPFVVGDPNSVAFDLAALLARIHEVDLMDVADLGLPHRAGDVVDRLSRPPDVFDSSLDETTIRAVLEANRDWLSEGEDVLLHGDVWPGNVLYDSTGLRAVIDWESASIGHPLADVSVTRLDLWFAYGRDASEVFTSAYLAEAGCGADALPLWDVVAAFRPVGRLNEWARPWPACGRPDVTEATMRTTHQRFLRAALAHL